MLSHFRIVHIQHSRFCAHCPLHLFNTEAFVSLTITHSELTSLCEIISKAVRLILLNAEHNKICELEDRCFQKLNKVQLIKINDNNISKLYDSLLETMTHLTLLNISSNPVKSIDITDPSSLLFLSMINMTDLVSTVNFLQNFELKVLETDSDNLCCMVVELETSCSPHVLSHTSCNDLLINTGILVTFCTVSLLVFLLNLGSFIVYKFVDKKDFNANSILVLCINVSDLLFSIPLIILWISHFIYNENFYLFDEMWKSSSFCYICFCLFLNFSFLSPILLCFLAVSRYMIVKNPLDTCYKDMSFVQKNVIKFIAACVGLSCISTIFTWLVHVFITKTTIPSNLCSPFLNRGMNSIVTHVFAWVTTIEHIGILVSILVAYGKLFSELKLSQSAVEGSASRQKSNALLTVQIVIVISGILVCWVPTCGMYLLFTYTKTYPVEIMFWVTTTVNSLNCLLNPIVFLSVTLRKLCCMKSWGQKWELQYDFCLNPN